MADEIKPWTIKGVPPEERNAAINAAGRADMNIGEWICRAIRAQVQADINEQRAPAKVDAPPSPAPQHLDATEIGRLVALAGDKPPRSIQRLVLKLVKQELEAAVKQ